MAQAPRKTLIADARKAVASCPALALRRASRIADRALDARLRAGGISAAQFGLMALIAAAHDDSLGALAERGGYDPSTLTRNLRTLEREGWVEIAAIDPDRRRRAVWLTESGARKLEAAIPLWRAALPTLSAAA